MARAYLFVLVGIGGLFGSEDLSSYFLYQEQLKRPVGNYKSGEIEVVQDPLSIEEISKTQEEQLLRKKHSEEEAKEFSRIGVIQEDQYLIWVRDAVYFPNKVPGTYDRIVWRSELMGGSPGVAVLPLLDCGKILLNLNYRHATRSWEFELPRGGILPNETIEDAARRELEEEIGALVSKVEFLGEMAPDTGILSSVIPVFLGKVSGITDPKPEESEAIAGAFSFSIGEIQKGLVDGYLEVPVNGVFQKVPLRDSFLTFALTQALLRGLLAS